MLSWNATPRGAQSQSEQTLDMSGPGKSPSITGEVIANSIVSFLKEKGLDLNKLAGAACDGASVMLGKCQGAMILLKNHAPQLLVTHCLALQLSLASCDAAASCSWFTRFEKVLSQIYCYFSQSTVQSTKLAEMQKVLSLPQLRPTETRWLSLENAVHALRRCFDAVQTVLKRRRKGWRCYGIGATVPARGNVKMKRVRTHLVANSNAFAFTTPK